MTFKITRQHSIYTVVLGKSLNVHDLLLDKNF